MYTITNLDDVSRNFCETKRQERNHYYRTKITTTTTTIELVENTSVNLQVSLILTNESFIQ